MFSLRLVDLPYKGLERTLESLCICSSISSENLGYVLIVTSVQIKTLPSLRAGSLGEREPARIPITFTCMRPMFGRTALIG
jgi:hypothetical protein